MGDVGEVCWVKGSVKYVLAVGECGWVKYVGAVKVGEVGG